MTPSEKAKQLYKKHLSIIYETLSETGDGAEAHELAIKSAKVTCQKMLELVGFNLYFYYVIRELNKV